VKALHCGGINLKADLIKSLLKDFTGLKEFSLSFASDDSKKREINPLL
jgi:hypothetical protein